MELIAVIREAWAWAGIEPEQVVGENSFGNLIVRDIRGRYWRLCPEDLYCKVIAQNRAELDVLSQDQEFLHDWNMVKLIEEARAVLGPLRPGYKYAFKMAGPLGGEYRSSNLAVLPWHGLIAASGHIAKQIHGLPNGSRVRLKVTE